MVEIRRAGPADGEALGIVHGASWEAAYAPFFDAQFAAEQIASRLARWHHRVATQDGLILLAALNGRPLAFSWSKASAERPGLAEILSFYAHPDGWGTGVAAELMTATVNHLRGEGFERVHLWTLRDTEQSRRFYVKAGFVEAGNTRRHDFGDGEQLPQVEYERAC